MTKTRSFRWFGPVLVAALATAPACELSAGPAPTATAPSATQPATRPATQPAAKLPAELDRAWRYYKTTWAGNSIQSQSGADQQLVNVILKAAPADAAALREQMAAEYERQAGLPQRDEFHCACLASRIALTWTRVDDRKELPPAQSAINQKDACEGLTLWGVRSLEHFAGQIDQKHKVRYKAFIPGTAVSMMSLLKSRVAWTADPGAPRDRLIQVRPKLEDLAGIDPASEDQSRQQLLDFYKAIAPLDVLGRDKQAIQALLLTFRTAYNARDDKTFAALWPEGHPAVKSLKTRSLARKIEETHWKIVRWEPVWIQVKGPLAKALVVSQYQTKDGMNHPVTLQAFPAKKTKEGVWKLN